MPSVDVNWSYVNQYKVGLKGMNDTGFSKQWFMITIVLQDTYPTDPFPLRNKIRSQIYVNGTLELDKYVVGRLGDPTSQSANPLRINQGNIYINPALKDSNGHPVSMTKDNLGNGTSIPAHSFMMADLTYFNYALGASDVAGLFSGKFNQKMAPTLTNSQLADQSYLTSTSITKNTNPNVYAIQP